MATTCACALTYTRHDTFTRTPLLAAPFQWTCESLIMFEGPPVCTDACMPKYALTHKCPATCAKANGALLEPAKNECSESCENTHSTCDSWTNDMYREGGCGSTCKSELKQLLRPDLSCEFTVAVGDRVVLESEVSGCVVSVLRPFAVVEGVPKKVAIEQLILAEIGGAPCKPAPESSLQERAPGNPLQAIISGPMRVSSKSCDAITLDAYQSTSSGATSQLRYLWKVPPVISASGLTTPLLKFMRLPEGTHVFGLSVSNSTHTDIANNFTMVVEEDLMPRVSLACPKAVCTRSNQDTYRRYENYEIGVHLYEQTVLEIHVDSATGCTEDQGGKEDLNELNKILIAWDQRDHTSTKWQSQKVKYVLFLFPKLLCVMRSFVLILNMNQL